MTQEPATPEGQFADLAGLDELPVGEHVQRFARVHEALRARLDGRTAPVAEPAQEPTDETAGEPDAGSAR